MRHVPPVSDFAAGGGSLLRPSSLVQVQASGADISDLNDDIIASRGDSGPGDSGPEHSATDDDGDYDCIVGMVRNFVLCQGGEGW